MGLDLTTYAEGRYLNTRTLQRVLEIMGIPPSVGMDVTIRAFEMASVYDPRERTETPCPVMYLGKWEKGVILSRRLLNDLADVLGNDAISNTDNAVGKCLRISITPHQPNDYICFSRAEGATGPSPNDPIGSVGANSIRQKFTERGVSMDDFLAFIKDHDNKLFSRCYGNELEDYPRSSMEAMKDWLDSRLDDEGVH